MLPLVSIILPVYNGERYIKEAFESCLNQTYKNLEIIVVNDGSTDRSVPTIESYRDPRVQVLHHNANSGLPHATNTGLENATGDYITRFAADDLYAPTAVEEMVAEFQRYPETDLIYSNEYLLMESTGEKIPIKTGPQEKLLEYNSVGLCVFFKRNVYSQVGKVNPSVCLAEDYEYWLRAFLKGLQMRHLDSYLYYYRIHEKSLTGRFTDNGGMQNMTLRVERQLLVPKFWKYRLSLYAGHIRGAEIFLKLGLRLKARKALLWAFLFDPACFFKKKHRRLFTNVFLGEKGLALILELRKKWKSEK